VNELEKVVQQLKMEVRRAPSGNGKSVLNPAAPVWEPQQPALSASVSEQKLIEAEPASRQMQAGSAIETGTVPVKFESETPSSPSVSDRSKRALKRQRQKRNAAAVSESAATGDCVEAKTVSKEVEKKAVPQTGTPEGKPMAVSSESKRVTSGSGPPASWVAEHGQLALVIEKKAPLKPASFCVRLEKWGRALDAGGWRCPRGPGCTGDFCQVENIWQHVKLAKKI